MTALGPEQRALVAAAEARASELERTVHGCAQCVLAALMETFGITDERTFKAASGLGGGVGLSAEGSCGALTGSVLAIGLLHGRELSSLADPDGRRFTAYRLAARLHQRFLAEYGSSLCQEIHRKAMGRTYRLTDPADWKAFLADGGHSRVCPEVVGKAARWASEILLEHAEGTR
jgi:C_GCAxxG_C_C family probable redox protein